MIVKKKEGETDDSLINRFRQIVRREEILGEYKQTLTFLTEAQKREIKRRKRIQEMKRYR